MKKIRCAIYTRKSSEEGLEQSFNSLDAQREACAAYVLSQASEGWSALPDIYDDGGQSGGSLERPALQRLLADIAAGRIDIVVVYKVDRLTRSLLDFARLVEAFDQAGTSFVSITQSFNTTTSMGRLTLNMLLSFAQFEREVTAERIRDKIAQSKARGMWMGGTPPLGYAPNGRTLAIVEGDAAIVRDIFARYLQIGNVRFLAQQLERDGVRVPVRSTAGGRRYGGGLFMRGQLYKLLGNPIYVGEIHHKGEVYNGQHAAIIVREMWQAVHDRLACNTRGQLSVTDIKSPSLLAGLIVDGEGKPLVATHSCKPVPGKAAGVKLRYRYYVSRALQHDPDASTTDGMRVPAREIEAAVVERVAEAFDDPLALLSLAGIAPETDELRGIMERAVRRALAIRKKDYALIRGLVAQVRALPREVGIELSTSALAKAFRLNPPPGASPTVSLTSTVRLTRTGRAVRLVHSNGKAATGGTPDASLVKLLLRAREWWARLADGQVDIATLARDEGINDSYVSRVVRLNFLAPELVNAILAGNQDAMLSAAKLKGDAFPIEWEQQLREFAER